MPERGGGGGLDSGRNEDDPDAGSGYGPEEQLRRALAQQRHAEEARRFFEAAPLFCIGTGDGGTWSLGKKRYDYWPNRPPAAATRWLPVSTHPNFEEAERRYRQIASPPVYYDGRGRLARAPLGQDADPPSSAAR